MTSRKAARARQAKWRYHLFRVVEDSPDGLTLSEILTKPKITRTVASRVWLRERLNELESQGLIWWNPKDTKYRPT